MNLPNIDEIQWNSLGCFGAPIRAKIPPETAELDSYDRIEYLLPSIGQFLHSAITQNILSIQLNSIWKAEDTTRAFTYL